MKNRLRYLICRGGLFLLFFVLLNKPASAQHLMFGNDNRHVEIGFNFGPTFFLGDLGGHRGYGTTFIKDLNLPLTKPMMGVFLGFYPNEWIGFRLAGQYTYLAGRDAIITTNGTSESFRKFRNLDFKSDVWEAYTAVELYPFMLLNIDHDDYQPVLRPYVFAGLGYYHFNPQGSLPDANGDKSWYYLHPLHTEGQGFAEYPDRKTYSLTQLNMPLGAGLKYLLTDNLNIGIELLYRKTFTDYIDDVSTTYVDPNLFNTYLSAADANIAMQIHDKSATAYTRTDPGFQRGNPKNNDAYFSFLFKLGISLGSNNDKRATDQSRCPARF